MAAPPPWFSDMPCEEKMMEEISVSKAIGYVAGLVLLLVILGWFLSANGLIQYKVFGPAWEGARREVYEQTKSFRDGSVQRLSNLCTQVGAADEGHKPMLQAVIAREFVEWNTGDVPDYLRPCLVEARAAR